LNKRSPKRIERTETYIKPVALCVACNFKVFQINKFNIKGTTFPINIAIANKKPSNSNVKAQRL
jgi:hypothetical protein